MGEEIMRELERRIVLTVLDRKWREHLYEMDYLQEGIGLRAMAQRDPLVEYKREGFEMFAAMLEGIKEESVGYLFNVEVQVQAEEPVEDAEQVAVTAAPTVSPVIAPIEPVAAPAPVEPPRAPAISAKGLDAPHTRESALQYSAPTLDSAESEAPSANTTTVTGSEPARNAPCPCGSGKKYKRCHGAPTPS